MNPMIIISTVIACAALIGLWLWVSPDIRAWLAGHWDRAWQAVEPHWSRLWQVAKPRRGLFAIAAFGAATIGALIQDGFLAAVPLAIATGTIWWCQWATRDADEAARAAASQASALAASASRVAATRDAYADALNDVLASDDLVTAQARARTALETRSYAGDLAAVRAGLEACELELKDVRAELADKRAWTCTCNEPREAAG